MSKDDAISIMNNSNLNDKSGVCVIIKKKKMIEKTYQTKTDLILNRAKDYYKNDKERLRDNARDKYRNLPEEEKNVKREYGRNGYRNVSEEKKQRLKEYQKNYREAKKSQSSN